MNKSILAACIAAGLGAGVSTANAGALGIFEGADATGNALVVPYYSVQNGNATLINLANLDTFQGKAVKVRFRGAERSDDVFDFQVFLSPGDMWTASITQGPDGRAQLETHDNSCTLPANVNRPFETLRLSGTPAERVAGTREGYVEIINMGDIITDDSFFLGFEATDAQQALYDAVKHVDGVAPCTESILQSVVSGNTGQLNVANNEEGSAARLSSYATGGLFANATIINVEEASAWSFSAEPVQGSLIPRLTRYWSQTAQPFTGAIEEVTLDGLFLSGAVTAAQYDFPDLSTPRGFVATSPVEQYEFTSFLNVGVSMFLANEYITDPSIFAETDWVISMPMRRYAVEGRPYEGGAVHPDATLLDDGDGRGILYPYVDYFNADTGCVEVEDFLVLDREERTTTTGIVISPGEVERISLCGEVAVISFNRNGATTSGALGAELTVNDITVPYNDGMAALVLGDGLAVIAHAFVKASNGGTGAANMNFGGNWKHRGFPLGGGFFLEDIINGN